MDRRNYIKTVSLTGVAVLAGCIGEDNQEPSAGSDSTDQGGESDSDSDTADETDDEDFVEYKEPPEATYTVAQDGSADYEELDDAYRIAEEGDVIGVSSGEYVLTEPVSSVSFVGDGKDETTITVTGSSNLRVDSTNFWDMELQADPDLDGYFEDFSSEMYSVRCDASFYGGFPETISSGLLVARDSEFTGQYPIEFLGEEDVGADNIDKDEIPIIYGIGIQAQDCTFDGVVMSNRGPWADESLLLKDCDFNNKLMIGHEQSGRVVGNSLSGIDIAADPADAGDLVFRQNIIDPIPGTNLAVHVTSDGDRKREEAARWEFRAGDYFFNRVNGKFKIDEFEYSDTLLPRELRGNVFDHEGVEWYFDGFGPKTFYGNAFINGDIRIDIDTSTKVYNQDAEIGNYYSEFAEAESADEGVLELPRPIPGDAELTDQYPLASSDIESYID